MPAKLNEKKGNRDLEREINNKGDIFFVTRTRLQFCSCGEKIRNASGHQSKVKMSGNESLWKFHVVVVQNSGKEMYKKSVLHVQSCFFAN